MACINILCIVELMGFMETTKENESSPDAMLI